MYKKYEELLEKNGITNYKVSKDTGISQVTLSNWKNGVATPKQDKLAILAEYFGVTVDYLMGISISEEAGAQRKKLRSVSRLEDSIISDQEDKQIEDFITFLLSKKGK